MSRLTSRFFAIPAAYVFYIVLALLIPRNLGNVSTLASYCVLVLSLFICVNVFVKVPFRSFIYSSEKFCWSVFFKGFLVMVVVGAFSYCVRNFLGFGSLVFTFDSSAFIFDWIVNLLLVLVASFAEEFIFRGFIMHYFTDEVIKKNSSKICYALVSGLLFTGAHFQNPETFGESAIWSMSFYFIMGFALMLIALKTHGIEASWGIHFANNLLTAWVFGYSGSVLSTNSLFTQTQAMGPALLIQGGFCMICCYLLV